MTYEMQADGTAVLLTGNDPAAQRVTGWSRYWLGVDLAQAQDNTALVCVHDECLPIWGPSSRQVLGPRRRTIVFADKFRGVSYPDIVSHVIRTMLKEPLRGRVRLVIDASGLQCGVPLPPERRAISDRSSLPIFPVQEREVSRVQCYSGPRQPTGIVIEHPFNVRCSVDWIAI